MFSYHQPYNDLIKTFESHTIVSCVLGISKKEMASPLFNNITHASLLLLNKKIDYEEDTDSDGMLIEYGNYSPNMPETEKDFKKKGMVIYRYGEKGGLRYYVKKYSEYIKQIANIGYIDLNIDIYNQQSFVNFMEHIAKREDSKWIQQNYSVGLTNLNSHTFVIEALKELKPYFNFDNIFPCDSDLAKKKSLLKLEFMPSNIKVIFLNIL